MMQLCGGENIHFLEIVCRGRFGELRDPVSNKREITIDVVNILAREKASGKK